MLRNFLNSNAFYKMIPEEPKEVQQPSDPNEESKDEEIDKEPNAKEWTSQVHRPNLTEDDLAQPRWQEIIICSPCNRAWRVVLKDLAVGEARVVKLWLEGQAQGVQGDNTGMRLFEQQQWVPHQARHPRQERLTNLSQSDETEL